MPILKDWQCNECGEVFEDLERPVCTCGSHNVRVVFTPGSIQFIPNHASTVEHVMNRNRDKMRRVYEEDCTPGSEFSKDYDALSYGIDELEKKKIQVGYGS